MRFQQDGVTCHTAEDIEFVSSEKRFVNELFRIEKILTGLHERVISRQRSNFCGNMSSQVYADKPHTRKTWKSSYWWKRCLPQLLETVFENVTTRFDFLREHTGANMPEINFKH